MQMLAPGLVALTVLTVPLTAQMAAGFISDANVVFEYTSFPGSYSSSLGAANFRVTGAAGSDHLSDVRWCWRLASDTREYSLHNDTVTQAPPASWYGSSTALLQWPNADNRGFAAVQLVSVYSTGRTGWASRAAWPARSRFT